MLLLYLFTCSALCDSKQGYEIVNISHIDDLFFFTEETLGYKICFLLSEIYLTLYKVTFA